MKNSSCLVEKNQKQTILSSRIAKIKKWTAGVCASICAIFATTLPASAAVTINDNLTTESMIGGIIEFIIEVARWMGFVVVAAGIFMFVFAYKDDNAEAQSRAARFAVVGAILLSLKTILTLTGLIS